MDERMLKLMHLWTTGGGGKFYQPLYGYFNNGKEPINTVYDQESELIKLGFFDHIKNLDFNSSGIIDENIEMQLKLRKKVELQLGLFYNRFELFRDYIPKNSKCFDYGCNSGYNSFKSLEIEGVDITGVDLDFLPLHFASQLIKYNRCDENKIRFINTNASKYLEEMDDSYYDCLICLLVIHHILGRSLQESFPNQSEIKNLDSDDLKRFNRCSEFLVLLKNKSKRVLLQLRLRKEEIGIKNFLDYLLNNIGFNNVTVIPSVTSHTKSGIVGAYAAPNPIYVCE